jgi:hypothetical protein
MIVNLWTTPRTGSNWYSKHLLSELKKENSKFTLIENFFNTYRMKEYITPNLGSVYNYNKECMYKFYYYDHLRKSIVYRGKAEERTLNAEQEEEYRLSLLEKHNFTSTPVLFYSHILPMSNKAYQTLFNMADKNIFLYRKDIKRQLSSYALSYAISDFHSVKKNYSEIHLEESIIQGLADRIIAWHALDKTNCDVVAFEDLDFESDEENLPKQQNNNNPFLALDDATKDSILKLTEYVELSIGKNLL